ncbi:MAG: hypothetical protein NTX72_00295 [Candidatus Uhrbacteria bacterium]|nr:hypothetical protein [Candidatus Uhrbacteria bacterium]
MGFTLEANMCYGIPLVWTREDADAVNTEVERAMRVIYKSQNQPHKIILVDFGDKRKDYDHDEDDLRCGSILAPRESVTNVLHNGVHEFGQAFPVFDEAIKEKWQQELREFCDEIGIPFREPQFLLSAHYG